MTTPTAPRPHPRHPRRPDPLQPAKGRRRRGNGEGSLYRRSSDNKWVGAVTMPDGRRRPVYGKTQREAREKMRALFAELEKGRRIEPGRSLTLAAFLDRWLTVTLPSRVEAGKLSEGTVDGYADQVHRHIVPDLGSIPVVKLSVDDVRRWLAKKAEEKSARGKPFAAKSRAYMHAVLRAALTDAMREEIVVRNVAKLVDAPAGKESGGTALTDEEARAVLATIADDRLSAMWLTMLSLGLRKGETLGMRWCNVDLDEGTVTLDKQLQRRRGKPDPETGKRRSKLVLVDLKTEESRGTMALPPLLVEVLRAHRRAQREEQLAARVWDDSVDYVFRTLIGTPIDPRNVNRMWDRVCDRAGVRHIRPHDLRHSCATFLLAEGVDLKTIQSVLRHTRLATTSDIYTHVLRRVKESAATEMDGLLMRLASVDELRVRRDDETA